MFYYLLSLKFRYEVLENMNQLLKPVFRRDINGLRGLAVILVVLFHYNINGFSGGFVGVDVFFVISGFLMTSLIFNRLESDSFNLFQFYLNRGFRIIPALSVLCLVIVLLGSVLLFPSDFSSLGVNVVASNLFFSNFQLLNQSGYFDPSSHENWLLHTWSLSAEWQFYIVYPIAALFLKKFFPNNLIKYLFLLIALASFISAIVLTKIHPESSYYMLHTRAWEMIAGGLVYFFSFKVQSKYKLILDVFGLSLILISAYIFNPSTPWPSGYALLPVLGTMLIIISSNSNNSLISHNIFQWFGKISYSLYLWHWPIFVAIVYFGKQHSYFYILMGMIGSIVFALMSYKYIEVVFLNLKNNIKYFQSIILISTTTLIPVFIGITVYLNSGFIDRFNLNNKQLVQASSDWDYPSANKRRNTSNLRVIGSSNNKVMFLGDSLVEQYYPWAKHFENINTVDVEFVFLTSGGCSPIPNSYRKGSACNNLNDSFNIIIGEKVKHVIIGAFWIDYFLSNNNNTYYLAEDKLIPTSSELGVKLGLEKLSFFISKLQKSKIDVTLILPTPISDKFDPKAIFKENIFTSPLNKSHSAKVNYSGLTKLRSQLFEVARTNGIKSINPFDYLCKGDICNFRDENGKPYYKDRIHFRPFYAVSELGYLDEILKEISYQIATN